MIGFANSISVIVLQVGKTVSKQRFSLHYKNFDFFYFFPPSNNTFAGHGLNGALLKNSR